MENNTLKEKMIELFHKSLELSKDFNRKKYEEQISGAMEEYQEMYKLLQEELESSDDAAERIARYVPEHLNASMEGLSKRKKELQKVDNNMAMVSYFVPLMGKVRSDKAEHFTDQLVDTWNEMFPDTKIGKSSVDSIQGGFRNGLCYITTAVCQSLSKPDDCYELTLLRDYRDNYLLGTEEGSQIVKEYYNIAPTIVNRIGNDSKSSEVYNSIWKTYLQPCVHMIEEDELKECQETYTKMVHELEEKYLYS